ncbi:hypothetical protein EDC32_103580 [Laceyella sacchari]|nr:hypothetical protein EDC32_103580 [Laceyella sacchari]
MPCSHSKLIQVQNSLDKVLVFRYNGENYFSS